MNCPYCGVELIADGQVHDHPESDCPVKKYAFGLMTDPETGEETISPEITTVDQTNE